MRQMLAWLPALLALITPVAWAERPVDPDVAAALDARSEAVARTEVLLVDKITDRRAQIRGRVRALYRLARSGEAGLWLDPEERRARVEWEAATRRVLARDLQELKQFEAELASARTARTRLDADRRAAAAIRRPEPRSLTRPVAGEVVRSFGVWKDDDSGARLSRRGIELRSREGRDVLAVADGTVAYAGPVRGLDRAVIVDHGNHRSVVARLASTGVAVGQKVTAGQALGTAAGRRIYLEIRLAVGVDGLPIDPQPLLR
jgi:septal ring factor EnvC (AmiA/AmiB activator)